MGEKLDYSALYALQDRVLESMKDCDTGFYLTGGTCLNRFMAPKRYSDDLDFFSPENALFRDEARDFLACLRTDGLEYRALVDTRDFIRLSVEEALKVDLVNDRVYRQGRSGTSPEGFRIDNALNILANKLSAVMGRDEAKDVFDIATLDGFIDIDWPEAISTAQKKSPFDPDELLFRLKSFPLDLLDGLAVMESGAISECRIRVPQFIEAMARGLTP